jgi:hypothetical protein
MIHGPARARYFVWLALVAGGVVLVDLFTSGFSMAVGPLRVSSRQAPSALRPSIDRALG